jgi:molybdopterin converting factor small subunit
LVNQYIRDRGGIPIDLLGEDYRLMTVSVQFHGHHRMATRTREIHIPLSEDTRVKDVIMYVSDRYPDLQLGSDSKVHVLVNNSITAMDHALNPNDKITFLPPVGGG